MLQSTRLKKISDSGATVDFHIKGAKLKVITNESLIFWYLMLFILKKTYTCFFGPFFISVTVK